MTQRQVVIGDGKQGPPYPEDLHPDARISKRNLLAGIRDLQEKMIARLADMEKRITDNADKAHAQIGSRIDSLGDHLDRMDADIKEMKGSVERLSNDLDERQGAV